VLQIDRAVFFSTAIIVAAFIPLFTMRGVEGQIFGPMARTYAYALLGALLATFMVTPCLTSLLLPERVREAETIVVRGLRVIYTPVLRWSLRNRGVTIAIGAVFFGLSLFLGSRLGGEFLPPLEEGNLWIRATMPPTISLEAGMPIVDKIRGILHRHPEVITVTSQHGRPDNGSFARPFGRSVPAWSARTRGCVVAVLRSRRVGESGHRAGALSMLCPTRFSGATANKNPKVFCE
jgi:cobalt-zinc-cadmium resistance protein CzcA